MYFTLPICSDKSRSSSSPMKLNEEWVQEIIANVQEHWGSPAIMTPDTLTYILTNQWTKEPVANYSANTTSPIRTDQQSDDPSLPSVQRLVVELCRTMRNCGLTDLEQSLMTEAALGDPARSPDVVLGRLTDILHAYNQSKDHQPSNADNIAPSQFLPDSPSHIDSQPQADSESAPPTVDVGKDDRSSATMPPASIPDKGKEVE